MKKFIELRNKPKLKFTFESNKFNILDASDPNNNGTYSYAEIETVELNKEKTDWIYSTLTHIADFVSEFGNIFGGKYKDKANLLIKINNRTLKIWLIEADISKAVKITEYLESKKPTHNNSYRQ